VRRGRVSPWRAGTSGSLILAYRWSGRSSPHDVPTVRELTGSGKAGWLFRPHDASSLRAALESAGADASEARARGRRGLEIAERLEWTQIAIEFGRLLSRIDG
jgi:glycosyltransferase involved in cell wall biosynthesis